MPQLYQLPLLQTSDRQINQLQQNISQILNPVSQNPLVQGRLLSSQALTVGVNTINHGLGRQMQGWIVADIDGIATVYRSAPMNASTLQLTSSAAVNVVLYVF